MESLQTTAMLKTARILRRVLETWGDFCRSNSSKRPSANIDVKNSNGKITIIIMTIQDSVDTSIQWFEDYTKKTRRKTYYSDQKQNKQHKHQQNKNNQKTKTERKTSVWTFQARNKRNLTRENWCLYKKEKP